jgi:ribosomal protein S18 acetylase RimI-like enzyme
MNEFSQRPLTEADAAAYAALTGAIGRADGSGHRTSEDTFRYHLNHPLRANGFEDFQGVFDGDRLVATARLDRAVTADPAHWMHGYGGVHPDYQGRGIGTRLVRWQADLAPRIHEHCFPGRPLELTTRLSATDTVARELFAHEGFTRIRGAFAMLRPVDAPEPDAALPEGLEIETCTPDTVEELRIAHNEIFLDHFRGTMWPADAWLAWMSRETVQRDLSFLLRDPAADGTIAGFVVCSDTAADSASGDRNLHLDMVGTRRAYRGRGVASGLITHIVRAARERGFGTQTLHVDAENPTGALAVYERAGYAVHRENVFYNKVYEV